MRIYFNNEIFYRQKKGGISRYFNNLFSALKINKNIDVEIEKMKENNLIRNFWNIYGYHFYQNNSLNNHNIFHETYYNIKILNNSEIKKVTTIHDMIYEKYPNFFKWPDITRLHKKKAIQRSDLIICVSDNTKKDLIEIYPEVEHKIHVIYPIIQNPKKSNDVNQFEFQYPYFLYVGNRRSYKNAKILFEAFSRIQKKYAKIKVLFVGGEELDSSEFKLIQDFNLSLNSIIFMNADDALLQKLYENAICLIITSIYEGFGLTGIEAMLSNCRIISSRHAVAGEILGDYPEYFDQNNSEQLSELMENYIKHSKDEVKANQIKILTEKKFTSKNQVLKYITVYESLIK